MIRTSVVLYQCKALFIAIFINRTIAKAQLIHALHSRRFTTFIVCGRKQLAYYDSNLAKNNYNEVTYNAHVISKQFSCK